MPDMQKFLAIIILMANAKKDNTRGYWSTNKLIETAIFA
jgi:hypothetical protein